MEDCATGLYYIVEKTFRKKQFRWHCTQYYCDFGRNLFNTNNSNKTRYIDKSCQLNKYMESSGSGQICIKN